jgi:hypothetical protein
VPRQTVDLDLFSGSGNVILQDAIGKLEGAELYDRDAIATITPVTIAKVDSNPSTMDRQQSGLYVLAVEDYRSVLEPADQLSQRLTRLGLMASLFLLAFATAMWLLVMRMIRESRLRLTRSFSPSAESNSMAKS